MGGAETTGRLESGEAQAGCPVFARVGVESRLWADDCCWFGGSQLALKMASLLPQKMVWFLGCSRGCC